MALRMLTAGESHGPELTVIVDGLPSGLALSAELIAPFLRARQSGYGRGGRQHIEKDAVEFVGGVRHGQTMGAPVAMQLQNRDFANWAEVMAVVAPTREPLSREHRDREGEAPTAWPVEGATCLSDRQAQAPGIDASITSPRPGHADLAGGLKHNLHDMRNVLERASARETASRVAAGSVARLLLEQFGISVRGHVTQIGEVRVPNAERSSAWWNTVDASDVRCGDPTIADAMKQAIDVARQSKDSVGGTFEVIAENVPPGLGTYAQWDRRLDGRIAQAVMSVPGIKGVEIGMGFDVASRAGSQVHDAITWSKENMFQRTTNHAGGMEGGMSNGEPIVVRAVMKPLATIMDPLPSVDVRTKEATTAHLERADTCVTPAASVIAEAMLAWVVADALCEKLGGDSLQEMQRNFEGMQRQLQEY